MSFSLLRLGMPGMVAAMCFALVGATVGSTGAQTPVRQPTIDVGVYECELPSGDTAACMDRPIVGSDVSLQGEELHVGTTGEDGIASLSVPPGT